MKNLMLLTVCFAATLTSSEVNADWGWRRVRTNCGYTYQRYHKPAPVQKVVQEVKNIDQTTVVNNLIGIPVPVSYNEPIAAQGQTVYGYSSVTQAQGNLDLGLLYNQAARLTDQAQQLAGQAATDFAALVQAEGQNRAEVAKILAQGQAARMALETTKGNDSRLVQRTFAFRVTQDDSGEMKVEQLQNPQQVQDFNLVTPGAASDVSSLLRSRCVACHGNNSASGGLNLESDISVAQQTAILERVTTDDQSRRMPRNVDGTAGPKLSMREMQLLFQSMSTQ